MDATYLLFKQPFDNQTLFKNQLDLAQQLLSTPGYYFIHKTVENQANYEKALARLKTYISQLLSDTAVRPVVPEFETSLGVLLSKRIHDPVKKEEVFKTIIQDLKLKNSQTARQQNKLTSLQADLSTATQIAVIAVKPFHQESNFSSEDESSLKTIFVSDVLKALINPNTKKQYSFNFPSENYCHELWYALENVIASNVPLIFAQQSFIDTLLNLLPQQYQELISDIKSYTGASTEEKQILMSKFIKSIPRIILNIVNDRRIIRTFHVAEPIYSIPLIAVNPDQSLNCKIYMAIEEDGKKIKFFKSSRENMYVWKFFVWDKLKVSKVAKEIAAPKF